jgi:hypothetical protein
MPFECWLARPLASHLLSEVVVPSSPTREVVSMKMFNAGEVLTMLALVALVALVYVLSFAARR